MVLMLNYAVAKSVPPKRMFIDRCAAVDYVERSLVGVYLRVRAASGSYRSIFGMVKKVSRRLSILCC